MARLSESYKKIISSSGIGLLFRIFGLGTSFLSTVIITNLFGLPDFGNYSLIFTISQACSMIFALGIPSAMIKIIGNSQFDEKQSKSLLKKGLKIALVGSLVPIAVFWSGASFLADSVFNKPDLQNYFLIICATIPVAIAHELFLYFFVSTQKFLSYNLYMFLFPNVLFIAFLWIVHVWGYSGPYVFVAYFASMLGVVLMECWAVFEVRPKKHEIPVSSRDILKISSPMMFSSLLLYLLNWTDIIMLGPVASEEEIGIYNIAYKVGTVGFLAIVSVSTIITPKIANLYGKSEMAELRKLIQGATRLILIMTVPAVGLLALLGEFILGLFNPLAVQGYGTLLLILGGIFFSAICGNVDQVLNMTNNQKLLRNITFGCFFLNVALNFALIPRYGINGAAFASLLTNIALNSICVYYIKKKLGFYTLSFAYDAN